MSAHVDTLGSVFTTDEQATISDSDNSHHPPSSRSAPPKREGVNGPDDYIAVAGDAAMAEVLDGGGPKPNGHDRKPEREWPEPEPLGSELPPVPSFDPAWLPTSLGPMVKDVAERMQVPLDFPAITAIAMLAGVCGRRVMIRPKAADTSWLVVPNLWGAIIGRPGLLKTPAMAAITGGVHTIETEWRKATEAEKYQREIDKRKAEIDHEVWQKQYREARSNGKEPPPAPTKANDEPLPVRRLVTSDATPEKLHEIMSQNPAGVLVLRDELTGWLACLEKPGRESERTFALEAWDGNTPFAMDRIGRGSVYVPHLCVSYFGGIQPARLTAYLTGTLGETPDDDGLIQRFQLMVWPDSPKAWKYIDRSPNAEAIEKAAEVYRRIAALDAQQPRILKFADDAQEFFVSWLTQLEGKLRDEDLSPAMQSHLAKYRSLMPSLALLFALADGCLGGAAFLQAVALKYAEQAAEVCSYLEKHARRVYAARITPEMSAAQTLARKFKQGWKREEGCFTVREVYRGQWAGLTTAEEARRALAVLEEAGWVRFDSRETGGRPAETYFINPKILLAPFVSASLAGERPPDPLMEG